MAALLIKNKHITDPISINDLGIYLDAEQQIDLIVNFRDEDIIESTDLQTAMAGNAEITLDAIVLTYQQLIDYLTKLTKYTKIDYSYISGKDDNTDVTGSELERLTDNSDVSSGTVLHSHNTVYYTKTELQTSGQASVDWGNIDNAPSFGSLNWKDPVDRTNTAYGSGTTLPTSGNALNDARMVRDDSDGKPAQYVCVAISGTWSDQWKKIADVDWGSANAIGVTPDGNLSSTNIQSALEELQSDIDDIVSGDLDINHSLDDAYNKGSTITVDTTDVLWNLNDARKFAVNSDSGSTSVLSASASSGGDQVVINGSMDFNGSFDIDATAPSTISVTSSNLTLNTLTSGNLILDSASGLTFKDQFLTSSISISQSGVTGLIDFTSTSIVGALNELKSNFISADTLDEAYDGPTDSGSGRTITADSGAVKIDSTSSSYAPLELTPRTTVPSSGVAAGQLIVIGDELFLYDATRSKWLSVEETPYSFAEKSASGKYMAVGTSFGLNAGYRIPLNSTIVKVVAFAADGNQSKSLEVRKNGAATSLKTFSLSSGVYTSLNDNINLTAGDVLQVYISATGDPAQEIVVVAYLKWRK